MRDKLIGVFDSGFGGLDILRGIVKEMPRYNYLYLGDSARAPYGSRSQAPIRKFTRQAIDWLFARGCELIVVACNTASAEALRWIQQKHLPRHHPGKRVLGVLIPAAEAAMGAKRIGVIATESTVGSRAFEREIRKVAPGASVFPKACPLLVPLVESGAHRTTTARAMLKVYLGPLARKKIDALILGCTHYGLIERRIRRLLPRGVKIVSEARAVPPRLRDYLKHHPEIERRLGRRSHVSFRTTGETARFDRLGSQFYGRPVKSRRVTLK